MLVKFREEVKAMKKFLLASVVIVSASTVGMAADLAAVPVAYDWTGGYIGLNAGAAWNNSNVDILVGATPFSLDGDDTVFTGGVEAGYNWQMDSFVMGLETDFNYLGFHADQDFVAAAPVSLDIKENWFGTVRGRLGFAADNLLFYGTGGLAYGNAKVEACTVVAGCNSESNVNWGWTVGAGMEYALDQSWIIGAEYLYVDLGNPDVSCGVGCNGDADVAFSVVRAKLDFKF
jgi:outer membrane immunogenic protein